MQKQFIINVICISFMNFVIVSSYKWKCPIMADPRYQKINTNR